MVGRVENAPDNKYQNVCWKNCASPACGSGRSTYPMVEERIINLSMVRRPGLPPVTERARKIYADCGSLGPQAIEMAVEVFGADRILLGTDTPMFKAEWALSAVRDAEISDGDKAAILRENALALLRRYDSSLSA